MDKRRPPRIEAVFLDFSKAFDIMPHHLLLEKLSRNFNIQGQTWAWLKSFLIGRQNRVMYRGALSSLAPVTSGVPQWSVLGPLLFNLFISDISCNVSTNCLLFADDTLLYHPIFSTHDEITLQSDINAIGRWSESNGMKINIVKSKVMHMTRSKKHLLYLTTHCMVQSLQSHQPSNILEWSSTTPSPGTTTLMLLSKKQTKLLVLYGMSQGDHPQRHYYHFTVP